MEPEWAGPHGTNTTDRHAEQESTETAICTSGWLHAAGFFVLCLAALVAGQGQLASSGSRSTLSTWEEERGHGPGLGPVQGHVKDMARGSGASGSSSASSVCGTLGTARRSHRRDHGNWEGMFLRVVLTGGTRLGEILIRRLVELDHAPSWGGEKSRASRPAGSFIR